MDRARQKEAYEALAKSSGWLLLKEELQAMIEENRDNLCSFERTGRPENVEKRFSKDDLLRLANYYLTQIAEYPEQFMKT